MPLDHRLELTILASGTHAVALARRGADVAIHRVKIDKKLPKWKAFRQQLMDQLRGNALQKLTREQIEAFGRELFDLFVDEGVRDLYNRLTPRDYVSWKVLTDDPDISELPWEFLQEPKGLCPRNTRCVVRILQTVGLDPLPPLPRGALTRALLVAAEPVGLRNVGWDAIEGRWRKEYQSQKIPLELEVLEGADPASLLDHLRTRPFDLVHFSCHGDASGGDGRLVLINRKTKAADYVKARDIARVLAGRNIRLVVLSACETSVPGAPHTTFTNVAETLIQHGIPAVVANQAPVKAPSMAVFVGALYKELVRSGNIDRAMAEARLALSIELRDEPEWGIPTLHRLYGGSQLYE
jgi:hypothetical protein